MAEETITKRLHVSGLTPAITPKDLSQKLGSFGTVTALDGFGNVDALGQPKKFGYVTIKTTKPKLARCMNLLSGVTWKGTKLRIGEAKPDFRERLASQREAEEEPPRKKRRLPRGVQGTHATDMSLVTPENVAGRGGWKVTPLGRLIRPIRTRPMHPLPEPVLVAPSTTKVKAGKSQKEKKRAKEPPTRARRQTIDPTKFGSQHLKGVFLENAVVATDITRVAKSSLVEQDIPSDADDSEAEDEGSDSSGDEAEEIAEKGAVLSPPSVVPIHASPTPPPPPVARQLSPAASPPSDLAQEKDAALSLLQSLFGGRDDTEWGDRESLGSDIDMDDLPQRASAVADEDDDIEVVPMDVDVVSAVAPLTEASQVEKLVVESESSPPREKTPPTKPSKSTKLKDLFAPRDDQAGFSLLGHLDLGSDLDEELEQAFVPQDSLQATVTPVHSVPPPVSAAGPTRFTIDQSKPFFYPVPEEARTGFRGRVKDPLDLMADNGWDWRKFCRIETSDEIRQRWEAQRGELTRDWKRRHREAIKSRRRRGGAGDGDL